MILTLDQMQDLAARCAPQVAVETLLSVAKVESGFDPLAVGVNGKPAVRVRATNRTDAAAKARALIEAGRSVDLGLAQINSRNLEWLGLSVDAAFDPCRNLAASARVLQDGYARGSAKADGEQPALLTALSYYNTGHPERGFRNSYVAKVTKAASTLVPAIKPERQSAASEPPMTQPPKPRWDVFGEAVEPAGFFIRISAQGAQE